jgi:hypothetical protein
MGPLRIRSAYTADLSEQVGKIAARDPENLPEGTRPVFANSRKRRAYLCRPDIAYRDPTAWLGIMMANVCAGSGRTQPRAAYASPKRHELMAAISFDQKMIRRRQSQQHHCSVCAGLSAQRERVWRSRTPSLTGLLLSPRQRRWAFISLSPLQRTYPVQEHPVALEQAQRAVQKVEEAENVISIRPSSASRLIKRSCS